MVAIKTTNRYTVITVLNWATYQLPEDHQGKQNGSLNGNQRANEGRTEGERGATIEEGKKGRREEGKTIENPLAQKSLRDWVTPGGKWTSDECKAFLKHHHWTPAKPELLCDLITEIDPLKLPDEEDDPDSLAGILARLIQFDIAWEEMYWLKADKKKARIAWLKATRSIEMVRVIQDAIEAQAPAMLKREPRHRPHMATWLNGERWRDELPSGGEEGRSAWGLH